MNVVAVLELISNALLSIGSLFVLSSGVGVLRLPDFYTRIHAASLADSAGAGFILLGLLLRVTEWGPGVRLVLIIAFLLCTTPTAAHTVAQAARRDGVQTWSQGENRR